MPTKLFSVILAGGSGTRLWPLSRKNYPKQFLTLQGDHSLLQQTMQRSLRLDGANTLVVSNEAHYFLCQEQLQAFRPTVNYLLEPCLRNTAPASAAAAHYIAKLAGPDAMLLILPSDHWIADEQAWLDAMQQGIEFAQQHDAIVTFGITPHSPQTGYGYIEAAEPLHNNVYAIGSFREKPDEATANEFIAHGNYFWNSGMFVSRVGVYLKELQRFEPTMFQHSKQAVEDGYEHNDYLRLNLAAFEQCRSESIDYAIMEKTQKAVVIPVDMQWSDLGCWAAVAESNALDENGNSLQGNVVIKDSQNCFISSADTMVTTIGIHDQIIVATRDAVLVADKQCSQQVKDIVQMLGIENHNIVNEHQRVSRPWGYYEVLVEGSTFKVKRLMVKPGARLSLQMHQHRAEHWVVVEGNAVVINDHKTMRLTVNQSTYIPQKTKHRLSNEAAVPLYVIEVQSGDYLGEDDIIRFDDTYERLTHPTILEN